jgi:hypothetical protein
MRHPSFIEIWELKPETFVEIRWGSRQIVTALVVKNGFTEDKRQSLEVFCKPDPNLPGYIISIDPDQVVGIWDENHKLNWPTGL